MAKEFPDLARFDESWKVQDQIELDFIRMKYANLPGVNSDEDPEWIRLRKRAEKNRLRDDGTENPHYLRMKMEADMARMQYEMAYVLRINTILFEQVQVLGTLYERISILEGAYGFLRSALDTTRDTYRTSVEKHFKERREWHTQNSMRSAGLDPDKPEDRLRWEKRMDEITARAFGMIEEKAPPPPAEKLLADDERIDYVGTNHTTKKEQTNGVKQGSHQPDGAEG